MAEKVRSAPQETRTTRLEASYRDMVQKVREGQTIGHQELLDVFSRYPNTLLLCDNEGLEHSLKENKKFRPKHRNLDVAAEFSYAVSRLINPEDFDYLDKAEVHFTDDHDSFYKLPNIKRASSRGRHYIAKTDEEGKKHLTFLIRRTDNQETPTDILELMSLISTVELARHRIKGSILRSYTIEKENHQKIVRTPYLDQFNGFNKEKKYSKADVREWAKMPGLSLTRGDLSLSPLDEVPELKDTASYSTALKIQEKLSGLEISVDAAVLGNDFTYVLTAATGLLTQADLDRLKNDPNVKDPLTQLNGTIKPELLIATQQEMVKRFGYIQFLNRYNGDNERYLKIKDQIESLYRAIQTQLLRESDSPLADQVSIIEFGKLDRQIIDNIPDNSVKDLFVSLSQRNFRFLNFSYPLGDNTHSLVKSLNEVLGIKNIGFFGKVGATLDDLGEGVMSGTRVGRIVIPEESTQNHPGMPVEWFFNQLRSQDVMIIKTADESEIILQVNGVLLQTLEDIKVVRDQILSGKIQIEDDQGNPVNPKKIRILLDMESAHLQKACEEIGIIPVICYYTSDSTKVPPFTNDIDHKETIATSLGDRGSLAVLVSGISALRGVYINFLESKRDLLTERLGLSTKEEGN